MPAMPGPSPVPALIRPPALTDAFGRRIDYLRVSVTDRCDLRCSYCMPRGFSGFEEPANWLSFEQIERVVGAFVRLGVGRVRLTGGEPLLRRNLPELAARLKALPGLNDLSLSTNATQLARHALALRQAGVDRLNISSIVWIAPVTPASPAVQRSIPCCAALIARWPPGLPRSS